VKSFRATALIAVAALLMTTASMSGCDRARSLLKPNQCPFSGRAIHPNMGAVVRVEGDRSSIKLCCVRCALSYSLQTGKRIVVESVTDYVSHKQIRPERAFYLTDSSITPCVGPDAETPSTRRESVAVAWDRCMPSTIAFADQDAALALRKDAGGSVETFAELVGGNDLVTAE